MALIRRIGFTRFSRWGENLGRLTVSAATHADALDGTDELKITCAEDLVKGDRVVWIDLQGVCHEHIVDTVDRVHDDDGAPETQATCINSINETWDDWLDDKRPSGSVSVALSSILADTRWEVGTCDQGGSASHTFYHISVREGIAELLETWGGELETTIVHNGAGIVARRVNIRALRGNQSSAKRFTWTKDLVSVKRSIASDNPKTRVYGYGKGVETEGGGYGRRLTFGDINGGNDYVEDAEATEIWGHPDGEGGVLPAVTSYVNEQCEDAAQLLQETKDYLEQVKEPKVTYTASVIDLYAFGRSWEGVGVGDDVAIIDKGFSAEGVRLHGRVSQIERDLLTGDATVTFGTLTDTMADMWQSVNNALKSNSQQNALYDAAAGTSVSWLIQLQQALNAQFNAVGTYHVETFELGEIWSNVPLNPETGLPVKATSDMWAINVNGRGQRLAAGLTSNGQWDWRTFFTGGMVTADVINAGTMKADRVRAGLLTDEKGNNFWDLTTGEFSLSASAGVGGGSAGELIVGTDVEFGLSDSASSKPTSWSTSATWQRGKYLWQRTKMTLADGSTEYTEAQLIASASGIGVSEVVEQYYLSTSSTTQAGGSWSTTQQTWVAGRYYWTRSRITWSDGTVTYTDPVLARALTSGNQSTNDLDNKLDKTEVFNRLTDNGAVQGIYMKDGKLYLNGEYIQTGAIKVEKNGQTVFSADIDTGDVTISALANLAGSQAGSVVVSTDVQYGLSDSATTEPTSWTSTALWSQGKHLWTRVKMTLADGTTEYTQARRIANDGGIGAKEVVEQYYLSTSSTTQAGGSWSTTQQTWVAGRYYWTRSRITWSDGTVTYTDPVLARALTSGNQSTNDLDNKLDKTEVFNRLTDNGAVQGIYLENGNLYINGTYIKSGVVDAALVKAGILTDKSGKNSWDLESGDLSVTDGKIKIAGSWNTVEISPENGLMITDEYGHVLFRVERDSKDTSNIEVMRIKFGENVLATLNANTNQDCTLSMDVYDAKSVPDANLSASLSLSPKSIEMTSNRRVSVGATRSVFGIRITDAGIQYLNSSYGQWVGLEKYVKDRNQ